MKCNLKGFLSLMLVFMMVLCSIPMNAIADNSASLPNATVTVLDPTTLAAGEYSVWDGSLSEGTEPLPLQAMLNFRANDTLEEAQSGKYGTYLCDFYLTFDGMEGDSLNAVDSYLVGSYGDFGWIAIPTDGITVEEGKEYPVVSTVVDDLTYETICDSVKDFTAALHISPEILLENPDLSVTLALKMTDPEDSSNVLTIGEPAVYTADQLYNASQPKAEVTVKDPTTLAVGEYDVWDGSKLSEGTKELPLQAVMNFKAIDSQADAVAKGYGDWICDFYLTFNGLEGDSVSGVGSYLAGNYGTHGWIAIPTDSITVEEGIEYPVVTKYDPNLTYENICDYVRDFTAALYINPETLLENPDMTVTLKLKMTNPDAPDDFMIIGDPAVYTAPELYGQCKPKAEVTVKDPITLAAGEYRVWNGSFSEGTKELPLQAVMNFKALDSKAEAIVKGYGDWICDFYLTFDGMKSGSVSGDGSYLAGKYGEYGWISIPTDSITVEKGKEYPVVSGYDAKLTYENICDYVKDFTAALYINPETLLENPDMTVTLKLKMTDPENSDNFIVIGDPAVYTAPELYGQCKPKAEVTVKDPITLAAGEYDVWDGSKLSEGTKELPLQAVMNFKAKDTLAEAQLGGYGKWICDFYLTFDGLESGSVSGVGSYLAGNYGKYGWIAIPTDSITVEEGIEYPVVTKYDPNLTYENICDYVKDFTAALYVNPETLVANPEMKVTLKLKMTNPDDPYDFMIIGEPAVYTAPKLYGKHIPKAEVTVKDPTTLAAGEYDVWNGSSLSEGTKELPLQAIMNFKAKETLAEAQLGGYGKWICDFYLTFDGMEGDSVSGDGSYLAGNYGDYGWISIPTDGINVKKGVKYPVVTNYDPNLTYENVCDYVRDFTAALYVKPEVLLANPNMTVTLSLQITDPDDETNVMVIGEKAVFTADDLLAALGYVAKNTTTNKLYSDVNLANMEAATGETVILLTDVEVRMLSVFETFDLNGHALTATYVTSFGHIVDNSESNSGFLKVSTKTFLSQPDNAQLPVNTPDGYQFVEIIKFNAAYLKDTQQYVFQPLFEPYAHELLLAGYDVSGVNIQVTVSWTSAKGEPRNQGFTYNDKDFLEGYINSYNPKTGKYDKMFTLKLGNITRDLTYQIQVISDNGVTISSGKTKVDKPADNTTTQSITLNTNAEAPKASALVPQGTKLESHVNAKELALNVSDLANSDSNITLNANEVQKSVDVHIEGVSKDNTVPMIITLNEFAEKGLNEGNLKFYHVENGETVAMTQVFTLAEVNAHNEFYYDPATGDVTMALATFSEVTAVSNTENAWNGEFDCTWYDASKTALTIANADQLAAFSAIVGGMNGKTQDSFKGKTVKLLADINLGDKESENNPDILFYPIGYYNSEGTYERTNTAITSGLRNFEGTFDGNGHTIANFYQNTWEMKGDHDWYSPEEQYYRDGMGLFGKVYGGTVKNLTVKNFSSDGEIATTGVIAAYADFGATFENIAITKCNPRVYNIGNGGIVGCVGWYTKGETDKKVTFKNITVDNSNKISALWGSYDVACGGIVGQYYPTSGQSSANYPVNAGVHFDNCHVSAQMDVYNDVCANYQYYAYRYTGMLIGSVRENETIDGHVYPKMDGITASGCTVHFGTWNDYYYCELVANSLASYTHDHQFSRLEQVKAIDGTTITYLDGKTGTVPSSGRYNYVVVNGEHASENATCYHFVDGAVWLHENAGKEIVNGNEVLKEDNQHIYLEFNNLVTGYGWGVTTKAVGDLAGVTILDREVANSVEKFEGKVTVLPNNKEIKLGDIFKFVDNGVELVPAALTVAVTNLDENNPVSAEFKRDAENWENGTIKFTGTGDVTITIQDYYFCTPTTITVTITEKQKAEKFTANEVSEQNAYSSITLNDLFTAVEGIDIGSVTATVTDPNNTVSTINGSYSDCMTKTIALVKDGNWTVTIKDDDAYCSETTATFTVNKVDKFEKKFTQNFLYRVGNANAVSLNSLFTELDTTPLSLSSASVDITNVAGNATGFFTRNEKTWESGTIKFDGTGVVAVTISADGANPLTLNLEVVTATNVTVYSELKEQNSVLLANITMSSGGTYRLTGKKVLYGNGFTFDVRNGAYSGVEYDYASYVIYLENSRLDNVIIEGKVYPEIGGTKTDNYYRPLVMTDGDCTITNCFLSNTFAPIRNGGNLNLIDTTLKGGIYANMDIRDGHVVLDNVTTINQFGENIFCNGKEIVGLGIVVYQEGGSEELKITIKNELTQYNLISTEQAESFTGNAKTFVDQIFTDDFKAYHYIKGTTKWANTGIISMNNYFTKDDLVDERTDIQSCFGTSKKISIPIAGSRDCYVYSYQPTSESSPSAIVPTAGAQGVISPITEFDFINKNYIAKSEGSNDHCVEDNGVVDISMDEGDTFDWDPMILDVEKYGQSLPYTVTMNNEDYTGKNISFNQNGTYTIVYNYNDQYNYRLKDGSLEPYSVPYTKELTVKVSVVEEKAQNAVFSFGANGTAYSSKTVLIGDKTYVMPDVTATVSDKIGSTTVNGTTVYYPITKMYTSDGKTAHTGSWYACFPIFKDALQIIDYADGGTGDPVTYNQKNVTTVAEIPSTLKATNPTTAFRYSMNATSYPPPTDPTAVSGAVCYTCNRNGLTSGNTRDETTVIAEYTYTDNAGKVYYYYIGYHCEAQTKGSASPCVTPDTLVTLADGSQKRIDEVTYEDKLMVWDFYKGEYATVPSAIIFNHGYDDNTVIKLNFSDGTEVKVVNLHQFMDADLDEFVDITAESVEQYIGHRFVKRDGESYTTVTLTDYTVSQEYVEAYGIISAKHYNILVEDMISTDFMVEDYDVFNYFEIGENMMFDKQKMQEDIEKYGLYTYKDFEAYLTPEQFDAFNVKYMKIAVGKGTYTYEGIIELIETYLNK